MSTFEFTDGRKLTAAQIYEAMGRYGAGEPAIQIARSLGVSYAIILHYARKCGLTPEPNPILSRPCGQCGTVFTPAGYRAKQFCSKKCVGIGSGRAITAAKTLRDRITLKSGYPHVLPPAGHVSRSRPGRRMPQHVLIAELALGRALRRAEIVHHIDGDKTNNARNNLLICTRSYHHALHARMAFLYQREKFGRAA